MRRFRTLSAGIVGFVILAWLSAILQAWPIMILVVFAIAGLLVALGEER